MLQHRQAIQTNSTGGQFILFLLLNKLRLIEEPKYRYFFQTCKNLVPPWCHGPSVTDTIGYFADIMVLVFDLFKWAISPLTTNLFTK